MLQELERLSQKFEENVLDATKKYEKLVTDKKEIEGLPATALGLAAQTAASKVFLLGHNTGKCCSVLSFLFDGILITLPCPLLTMLLIFLFLFIVFCARDMKMLLLKMVHGS